MSLPFLLVKSVLALLADKKRRHFIESCKDPEAAQNLLKLKILNLSTSPFPQKLMTYADYAGNSKLTSEKILFFETTSGSTGTKKEIPYTKSLLKSFENMFLLWAHDLIFHSNLELKKGKFFMSVSPKIGESNKDDRKYLSPVVNMLLTPFLVSNPDNHKGKTSRDFFLKVCKDLIHASNLEIISVWSPTYLLSVLDFIDKNRIELGLSETQKLSQLWPELKLISCWTHAQAEKSARVLQNKFPGVLIQPKGLLLTEAPVTIPWSEAKGNVPLLTETYFEFMDSTGKIFLLHELEQNKTYRVITSQQNGFLRYDTKDEVVVTDFYHKTPVLEFIGRAESVCDLAGEKISEKILRELYQSKTSQVLFVPDVSHELPNYQLYVDAESLESSDWEKPLLSNYHYELARNLGQLRPLQVIKVSQLNQKYLEFYQSRGMNLGDIKEKLLMNNLAEAESFKKWIATRLQSSL